jgi:cobyrinic acid a,c-diamide synthase
MLGLSVVLVVDCARMSHSVGALVRGYAAYDLGVEIVGLILNRVGSPRHESMLRAGLDGVGIPIMGVIPQDKQLALPERHLGLVQAGEIDGIEGFMEHAADMVARCCDIARLAGLSERNVADPRALVCRVPPLGGHIAVARDEAFAFTYPHLVNGWQAEGATISWFSPLADEAPEIAADAVFLPGGYPELHAARLSNARRFRGGMQSKAASGAVIYGECGGYMALGEALVDASGASHPMLGLLPVTTSFASRRRHLGYRRVRGLTGPFAGIELTAHEFHYSTVVQEGQAERLFDAVDAAGEVVGPAGLCRGNVSGSYMHMIDLAGAA